MSNVPSAKKRNRQRLQRRQRNLTHLTRLRTLVKRVKNAVAAGEQGADKLLHQAVKIIDQAAQKGVIKRETASRKISRLTRSVRAAAAK